MNWIINKLKDLYKSRIFWPLLILCLILIFNLIFTKGFFRIEIKDGHLFGSLIDILNRGAPLILMAIGMTLVIATGGIDISVGSVLAITGAVAAKLIGGGLDKTLMPIGLVIIISLGVAALLGMWNGFLVSKVGIQPVIATLILMVAGRGIAQLITAGQILTVYYKPFEFIGGGYILLPFSIFIVAFVFIGVQLIIKKTAFGLFLESLGCNPTASKFAGIPVRRIMFFVYIFSAVCAGIAGLLIASNVKSADANNAGLFMELDAILAVVLGGNSMQGGRFYVPGSVVGALIIQSLTTSILTLGVAPQIIQVVKAVVVIIIFLIQSQELRDKVLGGINKNRRRQYEKETIKF